MELKCEAFDHRRNLDQQRALFHDAFPEVTKTSVDKYNWMFHSFPNSKNHSFEYCSYIGEEMVGYYAAIPYRYKIGNVTTDVGMVCGVMTSSKHRGKGIFTQMGRYSTDKLSSHVPFTTGYPIRKSVIPGHLKVGWKIAFELPLYMKFLKVDSLLKNKVPKLSFLSPLLNFFLWIFNFTIKSTINKTYKFEIFNSIEDIQGYDDFVEEWIKSVPNALIKNQEFARWRYGRPNSNYQFLVIRHQNKIVGFSSYCSIIKEGVPSYCLLDLCVLPEHNDCLGLIYKTLQKEARKNEIEAIMLMMSKYSSKKYKLLRNSFLKSPFNFYLIVKNLTGEFSDENLFKEENWHLMWVDSDDL
jgi:hypothetical protein